MEAGIRRQGRSLGRALLLAAIASALLLAGAQAASAAPQLLAPGNKKVLRKGTEPLFKLRDTSPNARRYSVFMTIAPWKRTNSAGDLVTPRGTQGRFTSMKPRGKGIFVWKTDDFDFPGWFMSTPGKYYWQAYHIDCSIPNSVKKRCHVQSKIRTFTVR